MKIIKFDQDGLEFDNGTIVGDSHDQECCEDVYADWKQLEDTDVMSHKFPEAIEIEGVDGAGIKIDGYFIPCYNEQSGYYSSDLDIVITYPDKKKVTVDVSKFTEDVIC